MTDQRNRLVVADKGWLETAPEWLLKQVEVDRMLYGFSSFMNGGKHEVGNAEVCLYLYTLSLRQSMDDDTTKVYFYLTTTLMKDRGKDIPKEIAITKLTDKQEKVLSNMKQELYKIRGGDIQCQLFDILKAVKEGAK